MAQEKVYIPEVLEPDEKRPRDLLALRRFAVLLDEALPIPGTRKRVGLDAGLGLIPGVGDVVSAILSTWIIAGAIRHRVPLPKIMRMFFNVAVDMLIGEIPVLGDLFDFVFEQNVMNMRILMTHRNRSLPPRSTASIAAAVVAVFVVMLTLAFVAGAALIALVVWITEQRLA